SLALYLYYGASSTRRPPLSSPTRRSSDLHAQQDDFVFQPRELGEPIRYQHSARPVQFHLFHLGEKQPAKNSRFRIGRRCLIEFRDRKSTRLNSSHGSISYAVFCLNKQRKI